MSDTAVVLGKVSKIPATSTISSAILEATLRFERLALCVSPLSEICVLFDRPLNIYAPNPLDDRARGPWKCSLPVPRIN